jgi:hypothetical protein
LEGQLARTRWSIPLFPFVRAPLYWESDWKLVGLLKIGIILVGVGLWVVAMTIPRGWTRTVLKFVQAPDTLVSAI